MTLAQLSITSGRFNDCAAHLNLINFILDPRNGRTVARPCSLAKCEDDDTITSPSEPEASHPDNGSFIRSRMTSLDYGTASDTSCSPTGTKHVTVKSPKTWTHTAGCSCAHCSDPSLEYIWLSSYVVDALSRLRQGRIADAEKMFLAAYKQTERLVTNAVRYVKDLTFETHGHSSLVSAESVFQAVYSEIYVRLCELALTSGRAVSEFSSRYSKALDFVRRNYSPTALSHLHLTELYYLSSMRGLTGPSAVEKLTEEYQISAVDMLCAGMGRLKTTDVTTPPVKRAVRKCSVDTENDPGGRSEDPNASNGRCGRKKSTNAVAAPVKKRPVTGRLRAQRASSVADVAELPRMSAPATIDRQRLTGHITDSPDLTIGAFSSKSDNLSGVYEVVC